jgi:hypothetical protein
MGRAKDIVDLIYYDPFLDDKFKFKNSGYRYFSFADGISSFNLDRNAEPVNSYAPIGYPEVQDETYNSCKL